MRRIVITVFGSATPEPSEPAYTAAYELGRAVAEEGWTLCNGGYGGTMEAAARGAAEAGGKTLGVTCSVFSGRGGANAFIQEEIRTPDLFARLKKLVELGSGYVVLPGGTGTLLEFALVWELKNKGLLQGRPAPIVVLQEHWNPLLDLIREVQPEVDRPAVVPSASAAVNILRSALGG